MQAQCIHTHKYTDERWLVLSALVSGYMPSSIRHRELLYWDPTTHIHTRRYKHTLYPSVFSRDGGMIVADRKVLMWRMGEQAEKMRDVSASECTSRVKNIQDDI